MLSSLITYFFESSAITILVLLSLSGYFITTFWVFFDRYQILNSRINAEATSLKALYTGQSKSVARSSLIFTYLSRVNTPNKAILEAASSDAIRVSTKGLTVLSIIASTSPFIGLFGTVIGILETFSKLGTQSSASLSVVAPAISEALDCNCSGYSCCNICLYFSLDTKT